MLRKKYITDFSHKISHTVRVEFLLYHNLVEVWIGRRVVRVHPLAPVATVRPMVGRPGHEGAAQGGNSLGLKNCPNIGPKIAQESN